MDLNRKVDEQLLKRLVRPIESIQLHPDSVPVLQSETVSNELLRLLDTSLEAVLIAGHRLPDSSAAGLPGEGPCMHDADVNRR